MNVDSLKGSKWTVQKYQNGRPKKIKAWKWSFRAVHFESFEPVFEPFFLSALRPFSFFISDRSLLISGPPTLDLNEFYHHVLVTSESRSSGTRVRVQIDRVKTSIYLSIPDPSISSHGCVWKWTNRFVLNPSFIVSSKNFTKPVCNSQLRNSL